MTFTSCLGLASGLKPEGDSAPETRNNAPGNNGGYLGYTKDCQSPDIDKFAFDDYTQAPDIK